MKRSGTSAFALTLPKRPENRTAEVVSISGRDRIAQRGVYFALIGRHRRSVYQQLDGKVVLGDECSCFTDWQPDFEVTRSEDCVIDQHRIEAIHDGPRGAA